jgi:alkylation response protein AidB-like acyl-CoA dehydrogenase
VTETWDHLGLRASGSHDLIFEDVVIPLDHEIDVRRPEEWRTPDFTQATVSPLATLPRVQEIMGAIEARLIVNDRLIESFAADFDDGVPLSAAESNVIKLTVTNNAVAVVEDALSLSSNHGLSRTNPLERHYRDVLCGCVHTPQDDVRGR